MPSLPDITAKVVADPSGFEQGLSKAQAAATRWSGVISKLPGADIFQKYKSELTGLVAGFGAVAVASKALDYGKKFVADAQKAVGAFREQANEANRVGAALGVQSRSLFELQAAAKGADWDTLQKFVVKYNLAVGDSAKASGFAALGLGRVAIQGTNAVAVFRNLVKATEGLDPGRRLQALRGLGIESEEMAKFLPLLEGGVAGFDKRIALATRMGLVPSQASLDMAKEAKRLDTVYAQFQKGAEQRLGEVMLPADLAWARAKASYAMMRVAPYQAPVTPADVLATQRRMAAGLGNPFGPGAMVSDFLAAWSEQNDPQKQAVALEQRAAAAGRSLLDPIREQIDRARLGERGAFLKKARADLEAQGLDAKKIDLLLQEARALGDVAEKEAKLAAVRESAKQTKAGALTEQVNLLKQVGSAGAIEKLVDMQRAFYGTRDATESYILKLEELQRTHLALRGDEGLMERLRKREQEAYEASFGAGLTPVEQFQRRLAEIKGSLLSEDKKARAAAGALGLLGLTETPRQLPSAVTRGSQEADAMEARFRAGYDRKPEMTQERIRELIEQANKVQEAQLVEARKAVAVFQQMGLLN